MIFSSAKWNKGGEIRPFISVAKETPFDTLDAPLRNGFETFIRPLLGEATANELIGYYAAAAPSDLQKRLLYLAQRANVFLSFWSNFEEMNVYIDDSGMHRQESGDKKTMYKYQEQNLKSGWREKGFNALDDILSYLEANAATFTTFAASENFTRSKSEIVRCTQDVDDNYFIGRSRIIFMRLRPHFRIVERTIIAARLGDVYTEMKAALSGTTEPDAKFTKLRNSLIPVIVHYGVSRLIRETGALTDKGLFFEALRNGDDATFTSPVADNRLEMQATMAEGDAISYWKMTEKILKADFGITTTTSRTPKVNNTDKKAFWA